MTAEAKLSPTCRLVLIALKHFADKNGCGANPSIARLRYMTGLSDAGIRKAIDALEAAGLVVCEAHPGRKSEYQINVTPPPGSGVESDPATTERTPRHQVADTPPPGSDDHSQDQHQDQTQGVRGTENRSASRGKGSRKQAPKVDPEAQIQTLLARFDGSRAVVERALADVASTRKGGRVAPAKLARLLEAWESYPVQAIVDGCDTYTREGCAADGKGEAYLAGIVRNRAKRLEAKAQEQPKAGIERWV